MDINTIAFIAIVIILASTIIAGEALLAHHWIEKYGKRGGTLRYVALIWLMTLLSSGGLTALFTAI